MLLPKIALLVKKNLTHFGCFSIFILHFGQTLEKRDTLSVFSRSFYLKEKRYSKRRKSLANISNELLTLVTSVCIIKERRFVLIRFHPQFWEDLENKLLITVHLQTNSQYVVFSQIVSAKKAEFHLFYPILCFDFKIV